MKSIFLETSALLSILFHERDSDKAANEFKSAKSLVASRLLKVESERALLRLMLDKPNSRERISGFRYELERFLSKIHFFEITKEICESAGRLAPHKHIRTLDAVHLATYFRAKELEPDLEMLTYDEKILGVLNG